MAAMIAADNISKEFRSDSRPKASLLHFVASWLGRRQPNSRLVIDQVTFSARGGEFLAVIGSNGSGKSTLLRLLCGIYAPDSGKVLAEGKVIPLIGLEIGLQPRLSMRDNISLCGAIFGVSEATMKRRTPAIAAFSELEDFLDSKLYKFSQGMEERLAFSIAVHCDPRVLLLDELFNAADASFRLKAAQRLKALAESGVAIVFVTHNLDLVRQHAGRVIWLERGRIKRQGADVDQILEEYSRP